MKRSSYTEVSGQGSQEIGGWILLVTPSFCLTDRRALHAKSKQAGQRWTFRRCSFNKLGFICFRQHEQTQRVSDKYKYRDKAVLVGIADQSSLCLDRVEQMEGDGYFIVRLSENLFILHSRRRSWWRQWERNSIVIIAVSRVAVTRAFYLGRLFCFVVMFLCSFYKQSCYFLNWFPSIR